MVDFRILDRTLRVWSVHSGRLMPTVPAGGVDELIEIAEARIAAISAALTPAQRRVYPPGVG